MSRKLLCSVTFWFFYMTFAWSGLAIYLMSEDTELTVGCVLGCIGADFIINVLTMPIFAIIAGTTIGIQNTIDIHSHKENKCILQKEIYSNE